MLVFSDTHLTHRWFNPKKFNYLANIIKGTDRVAIVGDFWDGIRCNFDQFVRSRWSALFPILKSKDAIYIYGNHDREEWCDERVHLFSNRQAQEIDLQVGTLNLHLEHGNRITAPFPIEKRYPKLLEVPGVGYAAYFYTIVIPAILGNRWINYNGKVATELLRSRSQEIAKNGQWLICGHTHIAEVDPTIKYANSGFVGLGRATYLHIDQTVQLVRARY